MVRRVVHVLLLRVFVEGSDEVTGARIDRPKLLVNLLCHLQYVNVCVLVGMCCIYQVFPFIYILFLLPTDSSTDVYVYILYLKA